MRLLLTSGGITNRSIEEAFLELIGKPFSESSVAFIPTAALFENGSKEWLDADLARIKKLGTKLDVVDIAKIPKDQLSNRLEPSDVIFVGGGNVFYLSYWMEKSGLMDQLPKLLQKRIYAGISAGSMIVTDNLRLASQALEKGDLRDEEYNELGPPGQSSSRTLRLVNFVVRPHLNSPWFPNITIDKLSDLAEKLPLPIYAIDDQTAIQVVDGVVDVVSEGTWQLFNE